MTTSYIENVTQTLEEFGKSQTNWNNLPPEMKLLCIKEMDFKTRTGLRCSSKTERRLVDSLGKYKFDRVDLRMRFSSDGMHVSIYGIRGYDKYLSERCSRRTDASEAEEQKFQKCVDCMKQLLSCDITTLRLDINGNTGQELIADVISKLPKLSVKKLVLLMSLNEVWVQILKHCDENELTDITIKLSGYWNEEFFEIPQVMNAKRIEMNNTFYCTATSEEVFAITMNWWEMTRNRLEVGKTFEYRRFPDALISRLIDLLEYSIFHRHPTEDAVRATTSDPSLHLWIYFSPRDSQLQMFIVPADSEDPDFKQMDNDRLGLPNYEDYNFEKYDDIDRYDEYEGFYFDIF